MKFYEIDDDIYNRNFHLVVNVSRDDFVKDLVAFHKLEGEKEKETRDWLKNAKGAIVHSFQPYYYLWVQDFNWTVEHQGVLDHEIRHWVDWVLHDSGIELSWANTEVGAYYQEYIYKKCLQALKDIHPAYAKKKKKLTKKR